MPMIPDTIAINSEEILLIVLLLVLILWFLSFRKQKQQLTHLKEDVQAQKQLIETQMQDLTQQMSQQSVLNEKLNHAESTLVELKASIEEKESKLLLLQEELSKNKSDKVAIETRLHEERKSAQEKLVLLEDAKEKLGNQFKVLANQIFEEKGKALDEKNRSTLNEVLKPVREQMGDFRKRVDEIYVNDSKDRASLREQLQNLQDLNKQMNEEARNLTRALKGDKKMQGDWGELILETVLEQSGLRKGREYMTQGGFRDGDNRLRKPDVILNLPDDKHMIIDSKVSLVAYNEYMSAGENGAREVALKRHIQSIRDHIEELSAKDYPSLTGLNAPDFVFMFMPIEAAFMTAFQADEKLFSDAFARNIVVVTPTTLLATLRTVENIWRYERQNENARKIADKAGAVYDKLRGFLEDFEKIGSQLATVQKTYEDGRNKLTQGRGNLIRQAEGFVELGVKVKKQLPKPLIHEAHVDKEAEESEITPAIEKTKPK